MCERAPHDTAAPHDFQAPPAVSDPVATLRARRQRVRVTVKALAERAGYTREHTTEVLAGRQAKPRALQLLSEALDAIERETAEALSAHLNQ